MWEAERQRLVELQDLRRRQSRERVVTRARRQLLLLNFPPREPELEGAAQLDMATAAPDDSLALQLENTQAEQQTGRALRGQGSQSDTTDETLLGLQQEADLRGAVASAMGANPVGGSILADSSRRTNSPVERRLRELADSRNAVRNSLDPERSWSFGGARPRTRPDVERPWREDRGRYTSRAEAQIALSPRSAFNVNDEHGRFLAQRMERMEHGEDYRERMYRQDLREQTRRYEEDRLNWRRQQEQMQRQQDDMNRQMLQMQQQLAAMRLQTQQQQNQPQPPNMLPGPQLAAPLQQNQNPMPPPPNPPLQINPPPPPPPPPQPPAQQPPPFQPVVASPAQWRLPPPQNAQPAAPAATPLGARTPVGFTPRQINRTDDDYLFEDGRRRYDGIDRRNLKLRTFKGKDIDAWKSLFDDFAEQFQWTQAEKKLQLKTHVDDWIRSMLTGLPPETTAEEMMARLVSRFGVNMTATEVENELVKIERKPGEDLYTLADRIRTLANRAHLPEARKQAVMRQTFFTALRGNSEMQHWVNMYDRSSKPDINNTLDMAIEWERQHGTVFKLDKVRQIDSSNVTTTTFRTSDTDASDSESVHKIDYIPIKEMTTEEGRRLAKKNNELVSLMRKQAYTVLDEDRRQARGKSQSRSWSDTSRQSSSTWSRSSRSESRDSRKPHWRSRDKRRYSGDRKRHYSKDKKEKYKDKKKGKFNKHRDRKEGRVAQVREDSPSGSDVSASSQSEAESDSHSE